MLCSRFNYTNDYENLNICSPRINNPQSSPDTQSGKPLIWWFPSLLRKCQKTESVNTETISVPSCPAFYFEYL